MIRTPSFQKYTGRLVASYLSDKLSTKVLVDKIRLTDWLKIELRNFSVEDLKGSPLLAVETLDLRVGKFDLKEGVVSIPYLRLESGIFSLVKYSGDSVPNLVNLLAPLSAGGSIDTVPAPPWTFLCEDLTLKDMRFTLRNEDQMMPSEGMDYNDMEFHDINLFAENVSVINDSINANIISLRAKEKCGINLKDFQGDVNLCSRHLHVNGLIVDLNETRLDLDVLFEYTDFTAYNDFLNQVVIQSELRDCDVSMRDIGYFAPVMFQMDNRVKIHGKFEGPVSDFQVSDLFFSLGSLTQFDGDVSLKGLPDIYSTKANLKINEFRVLPSDVASFSIPGDIKYIPLPDILEEVGLFNIQGNYSGLYNDFRLDALIYTDLGDLDVDVQINFLKDKKIPVYAGDVVGKGVDIGSLVGFPELGTFDIDAEIQGAGLTAEDLDAFANIWIENLMLNGHHYDRVVMGGDFTLNTFRGRCLVYDEALELSFDGLVDFSQELPVFNFYADLEKARFYDMNLGDRGPDMELKGRFLADFIGIDPDSFQGKIVLDSLSYLENGHEYLLNHFEIHRLRDTIGGDIIRLRSDYADADAAGKFSIKFLLPQIRDMFRSWDDDAEIDSLIWEHPQEIAFDFHLKNTDAITDLFLKNLKIANGATIRGYFDSYSNQMNISGELGFISYINFRPENIKFTAVSTSKGFDFESTIEDFYFKKSADGDSAENLGMENVRIESKFISDSIYCSFAWDDFSVLDSNKGMISGFIKLPEEKRIEASVTDANAIVNGMDWRIEPGNYLVVDTNFIGFTNLVFAGLDERFIVDGRLSRFSSDTLRLKFDNWSIGNFSPVFSQYNLDLNGRLEGNIGFTYQEDIPNLYSNLRIDSLEMNKVLLGQTRINTNWVNQQNSLLVNLQILPPGGEDKFKVLNISGFIIPGDTTRNFDLDIVTQNLQVKVLKPFLESFSSGLKGLVSGQVRLDGTFSDPIVTGKVKLQRTELKIDYLNVTYSLSNEITLTEDAISFKDIMIYDEFTNQATCSGSLKHNHFRDMYLDLTILPVNLQVLNLGRYDNQIFFGNAFATGTVKVYGPFEDINIDTDVITGKGTNVFIPLNYSVDVSQSDFILFTDLKDSSNIMDNYRVVVQGLKLNMGIGVRPETNLQIFLPSNMGSIKASGDGNVRLGVSPRGYLTINGNYIITSGLFTFSLEQLVSKRFDIIRGSSIKWDGDMNSAEVKIAAQYRTKTSLSGLGLTMVDPSSSNKKVNVIVKIYMSDNLFNPSLRFNFDFPNLDDQTKSTVFAVLDTTDMALMNQQAISVLILNSFTYTGSSGSNPINSTAILANSLSSMLSNISNDFDIGINYIPGDDVSYEEVEVALSTQLFDDRLLIDGNFGVSSDKNYQNTSSIVGDVQVEYKLTPDGRFRVKAFNRSNDISIIQNDVPYTQGVGIFYRKDFNNLKDLFTPSREKKKRKEK